MIDFDNPTLASVEVAKTYKVEELRGYCEKIDGIWMCAAYIDRGNTRTIVAVSHGKKPKPTLRGCMTNAVGRIQNFAEGKLDE